MSTVETIRFHLRDGLDNEEFLRRNREVEDKYMALRPGFVSRETSQSDNGEWLVVVHWTSAEAAQETMGSFFTAAETQGFLDAVDKSTVSSGRYQIANY